MRAMSARSISLGKLRWRVSRRGMARAHDTIAQDEPLDPERLEQRIALARRCLAGRLRLHRCRDITHHQAPRWARRIEGVPVLAALCAEDCISISSGSA